MSTFLQFLIPALGAFFLGLVISWLIWGSRSADA
jgi:hypothetical protein